MSNTKAFPSAEPVYSNAIVGVKESTGMDLRDYFAAKAMPLYFEGTMYDFDKTEYERTAKYAYLMADAMMEARKKCSDTK